MKKMLIILLTLTVFNCSTDNDNSNTTTAEATLIGRWHLVDFEDTILYQFTADKRYTMYATDGNFETLEAHIESGQLGNDWYYEGDKVTIDLNFGNFSTLTPQFVCNNYVVNWLDDTGEIHSTIFREDFNYTTCNE